MELLYAFQTNVSKPAMPEVRQIYLIRLMPLDIHVIDIYLAHIPSISWVFDTRLVVHICNSMQGLVRTRRVAQGEIDIRVGNKARVVVLEVGTM